MSPPPSDAPGIRISDADREDAVARLHQALSEGRLSIAEFEGRVAAVYAAITASDLHRQLFDLPGDPVVAVPKAAVPTSDARLELRVGAAGLRRGGDWSVPAGIGSRVRWDRWSWTSPRPRSITRSSRSSSRSEQGRRT